jgi:hypothetical protein
MIKESVEIESIQSCSLKFEELRDSYLENKDYPTFFPFEFYSSIDGNEEFKYLIFPSLNQFLYEEINPIYFQKLAPDIISSCDNTITSSHYRTESRYQYNSLFEKKRINIPQAIRFERTYIYLCWIYMWCNVLHLQDHEEKKYRYLQL